MGTWGPGPFANDHALDWLPRVVAPVITEIDRFAEMRDPALEIDLPIAYAALGTLNVLRAANAVPPGPEQIERWRVAFFRCFDAQIDGVAGRGSAFADEWRQAIVTEFDELADWSRQFHG